MDFLSPIGWKFKRPMSKNSYSYIKLCNSILGNFITVFLKLSRRGGRLFEKTKSWNLRKFPSAKRQAPSSLFAKQKSQEVNLRILTSLSKERSAAGKSTIVYYQITYLTKKANSNTLNGAKVTFLIGIDETNGSWLLLPYADIETNGFEYMHISILEY